MVETKDGWTRPRKIGLAPIQREGLEYEYDVAADLDQEHTLIVHKSRCPALAGRVFPNPGKEVADILLAWLHGTLIPPAPTATVLPPSPTIFLTANQLQSLVICQKECSVSDEVFKAYLTATYQVQSRKLIPVAHYQTVRAWLTQQRDHCCASDGRAGSTGDRAA